MKYRSWVNYNLYRIKLSIFCIAKHSQHGYSVLCTYMRQEFNYQRTLTSLCPYLIVLPVNPVMTLTKQKANIVFGPSLPVLHIERQSNVLGILAEGLPLRQVRG